ncbi:bifunctional serine/threonine-protein kinase/formylglycine-generating enzyme family protein [Blastopirellula sp. J2-11]|uniref:bifunctional serine/threonine-protein kinase/formylglycine-generating enzyme family protein n=1 Tax=Blastopirellula sp. J2-11 TaxID=2943192 RepID=UPI0021C992F6|nr:bifunctional serine/threonine-protein kinase/formylglycine-generating enzyme family protein [Blastopirellula sp. J2-11]UUO04968.1 bifunctional serine/threonine-protein kinase/formylglycine-generating enzyme family protein [Blastopirellula sp. J2-11]
MATRTESIKRLNPNTPIDHALINAYQLDEICDSFENHWKSGSPPEISQFVSNVSLTSMETLLPDLIRVDVAYRLQRGDRVTLDAYLQQFPNCAETLLSLRRELKANHIEASIPRSLGHYQLLQCIGEGGFGSVWKARDTTLGRVVAIKLLRNALAGPQEQRQFEREAQSLARLQHPNIVTIHEFGYCDGFPFLVSEFIEGTTLSALIKSGKVDPRQAARIALVLADALSHLHAKGVVHRDLKPDNILFDKRGNPLIADFGLAKCVDSDGGTTFVRDGEIVGTLAYMSPEQAQGQTDRVNATTDIYALGVILYEMLTGRKPFPGKGKRVLQEIVATEPREPHRIDRAIAIDLSEICLKCLAKEQAVRYVKAAQLSADLQNFLDGRPVIARQATPLERARRWMQRMRRRTLSSAPSLTATIIIGAILVAGMSWYAMLGATAAESENMVVSLDTMPTGAEVVFYPLDPISQLPQPKAAIYAPNTTPILLDLSPGDYLVVAHVSDDLFHEVYRRVPGKKESPGGFGSPYEHLRWKSISNGHIELPEIQLFSTQKLVQGMAPVEGSEAFLMGSLGESLCPQHQRRMPSFYMDVKEVNVATYRQLSHGNRLPADGRYQAVPDDWAMTLTWDNAVHRAEQLGKRLPSEGEYEYAATLAGSVEFPWQHDMNADLAVLFSPRTQFGPVGTPVQDFVKTDPPIYGLCSNVAEWTMTDISALYPGQQKLSDPAVNMVNTEFTKNKVVRGGDWNVAVKGKAVVNEQARSPRRRLGLASSVLGHGVGFRGVRSASPRLVPDDFESPLPEHDTGSDLSPTSLSSAAKH